MDSELESDVGPDAFKVSADDQRHLASWKRYDLRASRGYTE
jgi:hypothetical protein